MRAAVVSEGGLEIRDVEAPKPSSSEVLIRVKACGLNRADSMVASGMTHGSIGGRGTIPGMEFAGEVIDVGAEVQGFKPGDRVMCGGHSGWAEYATADWGRAVAIPDNMSWSQAATLLTGLQTMHNAIVTAGRLQPGESVLIQGASTGVGLMGMQIAKAMGAGLVIGSSTNPQRRARLTEFGADLAIDSKDPRWVEQVLQATDGKGVHLIVDQLSGYAANQNLAAARVLGRIINVGRLGGFTGEFNFDLHAARRIDYIGVTFRTRSLQEVRDIVQAMKNDLWGAVTAGKLSLPVDREFSLSEAANAVDYMKANRHFGKIVLTLP
ncbi:MAG: quinone oxidoreductase family protein [Burkholderiaceae bacterium]